MNTATICNPGIVEGSDWINVDQPFWWGISNSFASSLWARCLCWYCNPASEVEYFWRFSGSFCIWSHVGSSLKCSRKDGDGQLHFNNLRRWWVTGDLAQNDVWNLNSETFSKSSANSQGKKQTHSANSANLSKLLVNFRNHQITKSVRTAPAPPCLPCLVLGKLQEIAGSVFSSFPFFSDNFCREVRSNGQTVKCLKLKLSS